MRTQSWLLLLSALVLTLVMRGAAGLHVASPAEAQQSRPAGQTPVPAKGKGDACVAPTDWMRRYHMTALNHQRDATVHEGIRTDKFSLKGCIECHAVRGADGRPVTVKDAGHFCRTCHDYTAVKVDCFECHASRPEGDGATASNAAAGHDPRAGRPAGLRSTEVPAAAEEMVRLDGALRQYLEGQSR